MEITIGKATASTRSTIADPIGSYCKRNQRIRIKRFNTYKLVFALLREKLKWNRFESLGKIGTSFMRKISQITCEIVSLGQNKSDKKITLEKYFVICSLTARLKLESAE